MQTIEKALKINLDENIYGTIAEIGAGQEVARNFFQAGAAAGTIAKSMSAYDMEVSNAIYGQQEGGRFVSKARVERMIAREYDLVVERLASIRHNKTRFFAFADTVAAKSFTGTKDCHGWLGIRYQLQPAALPCDIVLHVRMLDITNIAQQRALGILGINLIYGAFYLHQHPEQLIESLLDTVGWERLEIDMIVFNGPGFEHIDNRLMALHLVKIGHTRSVMFNHMGETVQPADLLYKKNLVLLRGTFRPITNVHLDIIRSGEREILKSKPEIKDSMLFLAEISMSKLVNQGNLDKEDFLGRVDTLNALGFNVQISNFTRHFQLKRYLSAFVRDQIIIMLGARKLRQLFDEKLYTDLDGGIYEGLGILFSGNTLLYVYPKASRDGGLLEADTLQVDDSMQYLFRHFMNHGKMVSMKEIDSSIVAQNTKLVYDAILGGDGEWRNSVPEVVYKMVKDRKLFGYGSACRLPKDVSALDE